MKYGLSNNTLEKITNIFKSDPTIEEAVIFASKAMGNHRGGSDIDIALKGHLMFNDLLRLESQLDGLLLPHLFDLAIFESIDNKDLVAHINRVGKSFYKKEVRT